MIKIENNKKLNYHENKNRTHSIQDGASLFSLRIKKKFKELNSLNGHDSKKITLQSNKNSLDYAIKLKEALQSCNGNQRDFLKLFNQLGRHWQYVAMYLVWKANAEPAQSNSGRRCIAKSALCLLQKTGSGENAKSIMDHIIEEIGAASGNKLLKSNEHESHYELFLVNNSFSNISQSGSSSLEEFLGEAETRPCHVQCKTIIDLDSKENLLSIISKKATQTLGWIGAFFTLPTQKEYFCRFAAACQNPQADSYFRFRCFSKLDPEIQYLLALITAQAFGQRGQETFGYQKIRKRPDILNHITNNSGISVLEQLCIYFEIQEDIQILKKFKSSLIQQDLPAKNLSQLQNQLNKFFKNTSFLKPIVQKMESTIKQIEIENALKELADPLKVQEFYSRMLYLNISGSKQCLLDDLIGMLNLLKSENNLNSMLWNVERAFDPRFNSIIQDPTPARPVAKNLVLAERFPATQKIEKKLHVLVKAYECAVFGLKFGGLGEAVFGIAKGLADRGHQVTLLLPKFDKLPKNILEQMQEIEIVSHPYAQGIKKDRVLGFKDKGMDVHFLEDTPVDENSPNHYSLPDAKRIYEDGVLEDSSEKWVGLKKRMAYFSSAASEYIMKHKKEIDIVLYNDWHSAYAIHRIAHRYFNEWSEGKTPASVFVIHNNNYGSQGVYGGGKTAEILPLFGDDRSGMNVMLDAIELADETVTVSPKFALEIQQSALGSGIDPWVRKIAHKGRLSGIANGSNPDLWDPSENSVLRGWKDPVTKNPTPLNFSSNDPDIIAKKQLIKTQLQKALEVHYPEFVKKYQINVKDKDLILYVGRYDSSQKGLEKFFSILQAAHERDAAFVTMGVGEDPIAVDILDKLEEEALKLGSAWITRGKEDGFSIKMQMGDVQKGIPGLGPLFRAIAVLCVAPSNFEPCGLVQYESWLFGALVMATATGGLADTIISSLNDPNFNGFTFERLSGWNSKEQDQLVYETTLKAVDYWRSLNKEQQTALMQKMMKHAKSSSWTTSPQGLTPIEQYERVFNRAIEFSKSKRGIKTIDLIGTDGPIPLTQDHFFGQGPQEKLYETYGAHIVWQSNRVAGVRFQLLAPGAKSVHLVIKDEEEERLYAMECQGSGNWQLFVKQAKEGTIYEYEIADAKNNVTRKSDPFAFASELRPKHASIVADRTSFKWTDTQWMQQRKLTANEEKPHNIYEVHMASWRRNSNGSFKNYKELAHELGEYCKAMHYTHIELMGIFEHPCDSSWGYQVSGYFAPTSRHGTLEDFQYLINHLHSLQLGIILDFVPFHFAPDEWGLREFSGVNLFESLDPFHGETLGWGTRVFDLTREDVRNFLLSSAHFFLSNHIDGFRIDAVSCLVLHNPYSDRKKPNPDGTHWNYGGIEFIRALNQMTHSQFPGVLTYAENSLELRNTKNDTDSIENDGLGFDGRWDIDWMYKALNILGADSNSRKWEFEQLVEVFENDWQINNLSEISHDETVYGKGSLFERAKGTREEKLAQVRLNRTMQAFCPANGQLNFMGNEFAPKTEWDFNSELKWDTMKEDGHKEIWEMTRAINAFYLQHRCLWSAGICLSGFEWVHINSNNCVMSYIRRDESGNELTVVHNFSNQSFKEYNIWLTQEKVVEFMTMNVVFNTDLAQWGGSGQFDEMNQAHWIKENKGTAKGFSISLPAFSTIVLQEHKDC